VIHAATKDKHSFPDHLSRLGEWHWHWGGFADHDAVRRGLQNRHAGGRRVRTRDQQAIWTASRPAQCRMIRHRSPTHEQVVDRMFSDFPPTRKALSRRTDRGSHLQMDVADRRDSIGVTHDDGLVGASPGLQRVRELIARVARSDAMRADSRRERHRQGARRMEIQPCEPTRPRAFVAFDCPNAFAEG